MLHSKQYTLFRLLLLWPGNQRISDQVPHLIRVVPNLRSHLQYTYLPYPSEGPCMLSLRKGTRTGNLGQAAANLP